MQTQNKFCLEAKVCFKCDECGIFLKTKINLKLYVKTSHPKHITCDLCESTFFESWRYEVHLKTHSKTKEHKCEECGKEFYLKWRFLQHMKTHSCPKVKHCHYLNNYKDLNT